MSVQTVFLPGLSPLARGTQRGLMSALNHHRFIPAGAGNTMLPSFTPFLISVYPRWRGEHNRPYEDHWHGGGLSPLARGTLPRRRLCATAKRFIPAGAGNTRFVSQPSRTSSVYPRWRGEHAETASWMLRYCGLSPLARGTPLTESDIARACRFIPAGAGNTRARIQLDAIRAVYPRWRGEHTHGKEVPSGGTGLSPLARGTPKNKIKAMFSMRFIPAGAGNTLSIHNCF